jgi:hypothetical protein
MDRDPPEPQVFDPAQSPVPFLPDAPLGGGLVLLVVASAGALSGWAERTALALAAGWAEKRRILFADLALGHPDLHQVLGVENGSGMSDVLLFGCSVLRVARPVHERGFLFVPAGTATASPEAVVASPRWASVVDACHRIRTTVVVFLPSALPGDEHLLAQASDVFILTDATAERGRALQEVEDLPSVDGATFVADAALSSLAPAEALEPDAPSDSDPVPDDSASPAYRASVSRSRALVLLFLVAMVVLVAAAWHGVIETPWVISRLFAPDAASALGPVALPADGRSFFPVLAASPDISGAYSDAEEVK